MSVLVRSSTGQEASICVVYERLGRNTWHERHTVPQAAGVPAAWVLGLQPAQFKLPDPRDRDAKRR